MDCAGAKLAAGPPPIVHDHLRRKSGLLQVATDQPQTTSIPGGPRACTLSAASTHRDHVQKALEGGVRRELSRKRSGLQRKSEQFYAQNGGSSRVNTRKRHVLKHRMKYIQNIVKDSKSQIGAILAERTRHQTDEKEPWSPVPLVMPHS